MLEYCFIKPLIKSLQDELQYYEAHLLSNYLFEEKDLLQDSHSGSYLTVEAME